MTASDRATGVKSPSETRPQPFLLKFASPPPQGSSVGPPPGTLYTDVRRETTDDR